MRKTDAQLQEEHELDMLRSRMEEEAEYVRAMEQSQYEAYCDDMRQQQAADEAYAEEEARAREAA